MVNQRNQRSLNSRWSLMVTCTIWWQICKVCIKYLEIYCSVRSHWMWREMKSTQCINHSHLNDLKVNWKRYCHSVVIIKPLSMHCTCWKFKAIVSGNAVKKCSFPLVPPIYELIVRLATWNAILRISFWNVIVSDWSHWSQPYSALIRQT